MLTSTTISVGRMRSPCPRLWRRQDLWLCNLLSDGSHEQPLNEVVEAFAPNILVQFHSRPHHGTSLHNNLSTCLRFVQLQSNFRQLLTIAGVAETFESLIWLFERPVWNFRSRLLLLIPHTCLPAAAVYPYWAFSAPLPLVLDSGSYLILSFPWLLPKCHQISITFSATWRIQSFLWPLPAGLSWYLSTDFLGLPDRVQPPML